MMRLVPKNCSMLEHLLTILERFLLMESREIVVLWLIWLTQKVPCLGLVRVVALCSWARPLALLLLIKSQSFQASILQLLTKFQLTCEEHYFPGQNFFNPQFKWNLSHNKLRLHPHSPQDLQLIVFFFCSFREM